MRPEERYRESPSWTASYAHSRRFPWLWWWSCRTCGGSGHRLATERRMRRFMRRHEHRAPGKWLA